MTFTHKGLRELFAEGKTRKIDEQKHERIARRLDTLDAAESLAELNVPGYDFHGLEGHNPKRSSIRVNGPWCITFEFEDGVARRVNLEQYH